MANYVDPGQTAPKEMWVDAFCRGIFVPKFRVITKRLVVYKNVFRCCVNILVLYVPPRGIFCFI